MSSTSDMPGDDSSPFRTTFDLYGSSKRRRGGLRRVIPASPAMTPSDAPADEAPMAAAEPRNFAEPARPRSLFARRAPAPTPPATETEEALAESVAPAAAAPAYADVPPIPAEEEPPLIMGGAPVYAARPQRVRGSATHLALPAVAVLAVAAAGAWFLLTPSHTAHTDQVAANTPPAVAPMASPVAATAPPTANPDAVSPPVTTLPTQTVPMSAVPPPAAPAAATTTTTTRVTHSTTRSPEPVTRMARTTEATRSMAANTRRAQRTPTAARSAETASGNASATEITAPVAMPSAAAPAPVAVEPSVTPAPAPTITPDVAPPANPAGAVNPPTTTP